MSTTADKLVIMQSINTRGTLLESTGSGTGLIALLQNYLTLTNGTSCSDLDLAVRSFYSKVRNYYRGLCVTWADWNNLHQLPTNYQNGTWLNIGLFRSTSTNPETLTFIGEIPLVQTASWTYPYVVSITYDTVVSTSRSLEDGEFGVCQGSACTNQTQTQPQIIQSSTVVV